MAEQFRMVTIGDSVLWGQGLKESEKIDTLLRADFRPQNPQDVRLDRTAHSGAVIFSGSSNEAPRVGEVPGSRASILEQCAGFHDNPQDVDFVLINGGINDVGVATILNPFAPSLTTPIKEACGYRMGMLLEAVKQKFSKPSARIRVLGYYPILSSKSLTSARQLGAATSFLQLYGVALPTFGKQITVEHINPIVDRCEQFFRESTECLVEAVRRAGDSRIRFVHSGFTDDNSVFARKSLLWGVHLDPNLSPEDNVAQTRHQLCDAAFQNQNNPLALEECYRASAGHPNAAGAVHLQERIWATVG